MFIEWIYLFEIFDFQNHDLDFSIQIFVKTFEQLYLNF